MKTYILLSLVICTGQILGSDFTAFNKATDNSDVNEIVRTFTYQIRGENDRRRALEYLLMRVDIQSLSAREQAALREMIKPLSFRITSGLKMTDRNRNWFSGSMPTKAPAAKPAPSTALVPTTPAAPAQPTALVPISPAAGGPAASDRRPVPGIPSNPPAPSRPSKPSAPIPALPAPMPAPTISDAALIKTAKTQVFADAIKTLLNVRNMNNAAFRNALDDLFLKQPPRGSYADADIFILAKGGYPEPEARNDFYDKVANFGAARSQLQRRNRLIVDILIDLEAQEAKVSGAADTKYKKEKESKEADSDDE